MKIQLNFVEGGDILFFLKIVCLILPIFTKCQKSKVRKDSLKNETQLLSKSLVHSKTKRLQRYFFYCEKATL